MSNYKAIVVKVDRTVAIPNADRIQVATVLGENVIVSKSVKVGDLGVFFCAGTQLSEEYCRNNNLYRDSSKNANSEASGFFEDNRRVRAQPFLKVRSDGYMAGLESLEFTGVDISTLKVGDSFEELKGVPVCKKYVNPAAKVKGQSQSKAKKKRAVPEFKEHDNTAQFKYNLPKIPAGSIISIQSKIHGTSARYGYHEVEKTLPLWKRIVNKVVPIFPEKEWEHVVGTRRVILNSPEKEGFHGKEGYRFEILEKLKPYMTKGMTVYGEIAGYANGKPIMSNHALKDLKSKEYSAKYGKTITYKYNCPEGEYRFHVYRITLTTEGGEVIDFTQPQLVEWCEKRGLIPAYDVIQPFVYDGDSQSLMDLVEDLTERPELLTEDYHDPSQISEGVIIRIDNNGLSPTFYKNKSYAFRVMEGIASEKVVEIEDEA